ncbi:Serpentine receptor class X [Dirofilaria immitis]
MQFASRACTLSVVSHCFRRKISNIIDTRIVLYANDRNFLSGIMSWAFGTFISMAHLYGDCSLTFHKNSAYRFSYMRSLAGKICSNTDASITVVTVTLIACIDFTTLIKIIAYRKRMRANTTTASGGPIRERGIMFFRQSCILGLIYIMYTLLMVIHPFVFTNKWVLFLASTVAWILVQSIDGLTFLIFNCNLICKVNSGVVTTAPATNWVQTTRLN